MISLNNLLWTVNPNDSIGKHILNQELWEPHLVAFMKNFIKEGYVCIDIGSCFGWYAVHMSKYTGNTGLIYAFEPLKENIQLIKKNIKQNNINNVILQEVALGATSQTSTICNAYLRNNTNIGDSFISTHYKDRDGYTDLKIDDFIGKEEIMVKLNKQLTFIEKLDNIKIPRKINFMKLDTQGSELMVLQGAQKILKNDRPVIAIELEDPCSLLYSYDSGVLIDYLKSFDYDIYFLYAIYPADHIAVPREQVEEFEKIFEGKIYNHIENNSLNNNCKHGVIKKIVLDY